MGIKNKYQIERDYISNPLARSGQKLVGGEPEFFVAHETANNSGNADAHQHYFNNIDFQTSAHTFIDATKILEIIPLDEKAWHVQYQKTIDNALFGDDANDVAIGVELCRTDNFAAAYDRYVWYFAYLCQKFDKNPRKDIVAHSKLDPQRRSDPQSLLKPNGITWDEFIDDVQNYFDNWNEEVKEVEPKPDTKVKPVQIETVSTSDKGKRVESIYRGKEGIDFYSKPTFNDDFKVGVFGYGMGWIIRKELKVGDSNMYEVENSKGEVYYITAREDLVQVESTSNPKQNKTLYLPADEDSWRVYPTNVAPVKGNEKGFLNPKRFNGLRYEILGYPQANIVTIQTRDFGRVNIYVHPSTGAVIK